MLLSGETCEQNTIIYFPYTARKENARIKDGSSERWAHIRLFGEEFNRKLEAHIVSFLEEKGYFAVAPELERSLFRILVDRKV